MGISCSKRKSVHARGNVKSLPPIQKKSNTDNGTDNKVHTKNKHSQNGHTEGPAKRGNFMHTELPPVEGTWKEILAEVACSIPWGGASRQTRCPWKEYISQAKTASRAPKEPLPESLRQRIMTGHVTMSDINMLQPPNHVRIYVSSVRDDVMAELTYLHKDVFPFLDLVCQQLDLDLQIVDLNWNEVGTTVERIDTLDISLAEIDRCFKESIGPAFICILGTAQGDHCLPTSIPKHEFDIIHAVAVNEHLDTPLLNRFYRLDRNAIEEEYTLMDIGELSKRQHWRTEVAVLQKLLKHAASKYSANKSKFPTRHDCTLFPQEIKAALVQHNVKEKSVFIQRHLKRDTSNGKTNVTQNILNCKCRSEEAVEALDKVDMKEINYLSANKDTCKQSVEDLCDTVCQNCIDMIFKCVNSRSLVQADALSLEVIEHIKHYRNIGHALIGRELEQKTIMAYIKQKSVSPLVLCGQNGCGRSALIAFVDKTVRDDKRTTVLILRCIGLMNSSYASYHLIRGICKQITLAYDRDIDDVPHGDLALLDYFKDALHFSSTRLPLVLVLDDIDILHQNELGQKFLSILLTNPLPETSKVVLTSSSTTSLTESHQTVRRIADLKPFEGHEALRALVRKSNRNLTPSQIALFDLSFLQCPLPMFLDLSVLFLQNWTSFKDLPSSFPSNITFLIELLFQDIEQACGKEFVYHAFGYITISRFGLKESELLLILSRDEVLSGSRHTVQAKWLKLRSSFLDLMTVKNVFGQRLLTWRYTEIQTVAEYRYLGQPLDGLFSQFTEKAATRLIDYYQGVYNASKWNVQDCVDTDDPHDGMVTCHIAKYDQSFVHLRVTLEYSQLLVRQKQWHQFSKLWLDNVECLHSVFREEVEHVVLGDILNAANLSKDPDLTQAYRFLVSNLTDLQREPGMIYQLASQMPETHIMRRKLLDSGNSNERQKIVETDPTSVVTMSHEMKITDTGREWQSCCFSPSGDKILATDSSGSLKVWETLTGHCILTMNTLPLPIQESYDTDDLHFRVANPGCWTHADVAVATENGDILLYDLDGNQLASECTENGSAIGIVNVPGTGMLVTCFRNGTVYICQASNLEHVVTIQTEKQATGLAVGSDGKSAVITPKDNDSLIMLDMETFTYRLLQSHDDDRKSTDFHKRNQTEEPSGGQPGSEVRSNQICVTEVSGQLDSITTLKDHGKSEQTYLSCGDQKQVDDETTTEWTDGQTADRALSFEDQKQVADETSTELTDGQIADRAIEATSGDNEIRVRVSDTRDTTLCSVFHPDCTTVMTGSANGQLREWDLRKCLKGEVQTLRFAGHRGAIKSIQFNRDGSLMLTASCDRRIIVWRRVEANWGVISVLYGHTDTVMALSAHPGNSAELVSASLDGSIMLWNIANTETINPASLQIDKMDIFNTDQTVCTHGHHGDILAYSAKSQLIARRICSRSGFCIFNIADKSGGHVKKMSDGSFVTKVEFTSQGTHLVALISTSEDVKCFESTSGPECVRVFDSQTGTMLHDFSEDVELPSDFSCGSDVIAIGTFQGEVFLFDSSNFTCRMTWCGMKPITSIVCSPSGRLILITSGPDVTLLTIGETLKESWASIPQHDSDITAAAFSSQDVVFVTGTSSGKLRVWNFLDNKVTCLAVWKTHQGPVISISFMETGLYLVTCSKYNLRIWCMESVLQLTGSFFGSFSRAYFLDDRTIIASENTGRLITLKL